jgi:GH15 family glucan-1,4-alpha-glucosidase
MSEVKTCRISDYGLIGNCRTAALVSNRGSIDWCCFPKFDSPSYFARLLDGAGGHFSITPTRPFQSHQAYFENTNVLQTTFRGEGNAAVLTDLFSVKDQYVHTDELWPDEEILRIVEGQEGEMELELELLPRADYGRRGLRFRWIGDWGIKCGDGRKHFLLQTSLKPTDVRVQESHMGDHVSAKFMIRAGERAIISLCYSDEAPSVMPPLETAFERLNHTISYWKGWTVSCPGGGIYKKLIVRSALALKLLNFAPSGAFIAAPTTSLPESLHGSRNWDYRFCWLRDAAFTTRALLRIGHLDEAKAFLSWLFHATRLTWPKLQVMYTVYGEAKIPECIADWMSGYRGSKPVRIGNHASTQVQLDVYGEVIDSLYELIDFLVPIDTDTKELVIGYGRTVASHWNNPDQGIWEFRTRPMHYTHSKVMCWVAMDRLAKLSQKLKWELPYDALMISHEIRNEIESKGYNSKLNSYTRAFGESELDASLLVMPIVGYCDAKSPRFQSTREVIIQNLSENNLIYRYPRDSDGFAEPEGTFTICNFWLAETFALSGDLSEAEKWFNAVASSLAVTGLSAEEIEPQSGEYLGNHPQGFSHIGMINAALAIDDLRKSQMERSKVAI